MTADPAVGGGTPDARRTVAGVVLAAGAGRRFGTPKALVRYDGAFLVERAAATLARGGCTDVVVVLGAGAPDVVRQADLAGARVVVNERWDDGMSGSLRVGLDACAGAGAAVVALVDQPGVTAAVIRRMIAAWASGDRPVVAATYGGVVRNPVLFGAQVWSDLLSNVAGDAGAREWLRAHGELVEKVEVADIGDCTDIDTPEDLRSREQGS